MKKEISTKDLFNFVISVIIVYIIFSIIESINPIFEPGVFDNA